MKCVIFALLALLTVASAHIEFNPSTYQITHISYDASKMVEDWSDVGRGPFIARPFTSYGPNPNVINTTYLGNLIDIEFTLYTNVEPGIPPPPNANFYEAIEVKCPFANPQEATDNGNDQDDDENNVCQKNSQRWRKLYRRCADNFYTDFLRFKCGEGIQQTIPANKTVNGSPNAVNDALVAELVSKNHDVLMLMYLKSATVPGAVIKITYVSARRNTRPFSEQVAYAYEFTNFIFPS
jgi:hypothetical protein